MKTPENKIYVSEMNLSFPILTLRCLNLSFSCINVTGIASIGKEIIRVSRKLEGEGPTGGHRACDELH
ncbi:MAG: hypothetical protein PF483_06500 [Halothiobacillus sp.]|jgi:hypothetical protein|nr:hypothetical protein [Halothiobacillus sp.]